MASVSIREKTQTRELILDAAINLFRKGGYEACTMRAIADEAGVSLGSAYYYFASKEHLVLGFYQQLSLEQQARVPDICSRTRVFKDRLKSLIRNNLATVENSRELFNDLFRYAADSRSPLNPFSSESSLVRQRAIGMFAAVVEGSDLKVSNELVAELPGLLWVYYMGIVLYWLHDKSFAARKTNKLIELSSDLISKIISVLSLPMMGGILRSVVDLLKEFREDDDL